MILTEEQLLIQQSARKFAQERLAPNSARWEEEARFPREIIAEMGALGFMGMTVPAEWGGAGADNVAYSLALQEIAAGDGALATVVSGHNSVGVMPILIYGTQAQKERYVRDLATGEVTAFA
jgi:alkylation response protein AidB-like acyl-CoA dehydrogenase